MEQSESSKVNGNEHMISKLKKSLYGLKHASRQWYKKFDSFTPEYGYKRTYANHCIYIRCFHDNDFIILSLYIDDILVVGKDP